MFAVVVVVVVDWDTFLTDSTRYSEDNQDNSLAEDTDKDTDTDYYHTLAADTAQHYHNLADQEILLLAVMSLIAAMMIVSPSPNQQVSSPPDLQLSSPQQSQSDSTIPGGYETEHHPPPHRPPPATPPQLRAAGINPQNQQNINLDEREDLVNQREIDISQREFQLKQMEKDLSEKEKTLKEYEADLKKSKMI